VEQLYELNRELTKAEGQLLRLAIDSKIDREEFLENYYGFEVDPNWGDHIIACARRSGAISFARTSPTSKVCAASL